MMKSLLLVINEEYLSKGITLAIMDYFKSIHTTKNPYEAIEILKSEKIDVILTNINFNTIDSDNYIKNILENSKDIKGIIFINDAQIQFDSSYLSKTIVVQHKPISIKKIKKYVNAFLNKSLEVKKGELK